MAAAGRRMDYIGLGKTMFFLLLLPIKDSECARGDYAKKLVDDIFLNYKKEIRPVNNTSDAVSVNFTVFLFQILELDERNQILTAYLWLRQEWKDANLVWNPKKYDGLEHIRLPSAMIWLPDIVLYNNADAQFAKNLQTNVVLTSKGEIRWDQPAITKTSCRMDVSYFPFDSQSCDYTFGSWTFYLEHLDIIPAQTQGNRDDFVPNVEWKVTDMPVRRILEQYSCCPDPYPIVKITLELKRKSTFYVFNLFLPCVFISILLPLTFYLPAESGEKVSLGITTLLAMTVFQLLVAESMPPSETIPLIGKYYITTMALMSFSTATTIFVQNIHFCGPNPPPIPRWMKKYILHYLARFLNIKIQRKPVVSTPEPGVANHMPVYNSDKLVETRRSKADDRPKDRGETTPFLLCPKQLGMEKKSEATDTAAKHNGSCFGCRFAASNYLSSDGQVVSTKPSANTCPRNFPGSDSCRGSCPTLSDCRTENQIICRDVNSTHSTLPQTPSFPATTRPAQKRGFSHQCPKALTSSRSATPTSLPTNGKDTVSRKRRTLLQMNATSKTADFSDDTEASAATPTCSDSPKPHLLEFSPISSTIKNRSSGEISEQERSFYFGRSNDYTRPSASTIDLPISERPDGFDYLSNSNGHESDIKTEPLRARSSRRSNRAIFTNSNMKRSKSRSPSNFIEMNGKGLQPPTGRPLRKATLFQNHSAQTPASDDCSHRIEDARVRNTISKNIASIADHFRRQRKVVNNADEWKSLSRVCDRALMWIFVIIQVLFSTLILCKLL